LSNSTESDLYRISCRNGLNLSWAQWVQHRGSVFCAELGTDVGLPRGLAPGVITQATFQVEMDCVSNFPDTTNLEFYVLLMLEGTFTVSTNFAAASLGNLSVDVVLGASNMAGLNYKAYKHMSGGSFWSSLKSILHKFGGTAANLGSGLATAMGHPELSAGIEVARNLGQAIGDTGRYAQRVSAPSRAGGSLGARSRHALRQGRGLGGMRRLR